MVEIFLGHVLARLAALAEKSVHCIVTSPPYWGLRAYAGVEPAVWLGAAGKADCPHEWGEALPKPGNEHRDGLGANSTFAGRGDKAEIRKEFAGKRAGEVNASIERARERGYDVGGWGASERAATAIDRMGSSGGQFCRLCGAWRGLLGQEPLHDCLAWARGEAPCASCFVCHMRSVAAACWRVLRDDGVMWLNMGDSYGGSWAMQDRRADALDRQGAYMRSERASCRAGTLKETELALVPQRLMIAFQADGWYMRSDIQNDIAPVVVWKKRSAMPESTDKRPTRNHEYILMLTKRPSSEHFFDAVAVREGAAIRPHENADRKYHTGHGVEVDTRSSDEKGQSNVPHAGNGSRNIRTVWTLKPEPCNWAFCKGCDTCFIGSDRNRIRVEGEPPDQKRFCPVCGRHDAWVAHYAAYPSDLPRRCILAGTPEKGICAQCGTPWERVVEREPDNAGYPHGPGGSKRYQNVLNGGEASSTLAKVARYSVGTLGFRPGCSCAAGEPVPATILDPFCGSGTSLIVAAQLGRNAIGIDASPDYVKVARERVRIEGSRVAKPIPASDAPLFASVPSV